MSLRGSGREVGRSVIGHWVTSLLLALIAGASVAIVLVTSALNAQLSAGVRSELNSPETRLIVVQATPSDGLDRRVVDRLEVSHDIEWAVALGPAFDVSNAIIQESSTVVARRAWSDSWPAFGLPMPQCDDGPPRGFATKDAVRDLSIADIEGGRGVVSSRAGYHFGIASTWHRPGLLGNYAGGVLVPSCSEDAGPVTAILVQTRTPEGVAPTLNLVRSLIPEPAPESLTIKSNVEKAEEAVSVARQFERHTATSLCITMAAAGFLVMSLQSALVVLRRRDHGRRRALGATRTAVVAYFVGEALVAACAGQVFASLSLWAALPGYLEGSSSFLQVIAANVIVLAVIAATAVVPALVASRIDPARELRAP